MSQQSGIRIERASQPGIAINGQTIEVSNEESTVYAYLKVVNITSNTNSYFWSRTFCSGNPGLTGEQFCDNWSCVDLPQDGDWTSPSRELNADESSLFEPKVVFDPSECDSVLLCYYVLNSNMETIDSVKIRFIYLNSNVCPETANSTIYDLNQTQIYPNPSAGIVQLNNIPSDAQIDIINLTGHIVFTTNSTNSTEKVDISAFPDGMYFFTITLNNGSALVRKIVLSK
jgi:hypothetical protein